MRTNVWASKEIIDSVYHDAIENHTTHPTFDFAEFTGVPIRNALNASHTFIQETELNFTITNQECA
jgi:hypothetical protein